MAIPLAAGLVYVVSSPVSAVHGSVPCSTSLSKTCLLIPAFNLHVNVIRPTIYQPVPVHRKFGIICCRISSTVDGQTFDADILDHWTHFNTLRISTRPEGP